MIKLSVVFILLVFQGGCNYASDHQLEEKFYADKADFTNLGKMLDEDKSIAVLDSENIFYGGDTAQAISPERLNQYRKLLQKLKLEGIYRDSELSVNLIVSHKGFPIHTSGKGFYYSAGNVSPIVQSLDPVIRNDRGDTRPTYKRIEDKWYLVYESW